MKISKSRIVFQCFNYAILFLLGAAAVYPVLYVLAASFSSYEFIAQGRVGILPMGFNIEAYKRILTYPMIGRAYLNTIFYTVAGTVISLVLSALAAYPISRRPFPGQALMSGVIVVAMLFSAGMIPTYIVVTKLKMYNTVWSLLIPTAVSSFNVILLKNFFQQIPYELEESAQLDGCSQMRILFQIILPLAKPGVVTVCLFYAVAQWNSYFPAMLYLRDRELIPMQILLRDIVIQNQTTELGIDLVKGSDQITESVKYATIMVATIPIMMVYPFIQKYFVKGIMVGSVKG